LEWFDGLRGQEASEAVVSVPIVSSYTRILFPTIFFFRIPAKRAWGLFRSSNSATGQTPPTQLPQSKWVSLGLPFNLSLILVFRFSSGTGAADWERGMKHSSPRGLPLNDQEDPDVTLSQTIAGHLRDRRWTR
jgi:hypothetical protein